MADSTDTSRLAELRASARGWHGVQLAVLGFIGLCGVLQGRDQSLPRWLQVLAGGLVLGALALACIATILVAFAAWPVYARSPLPDDQAEIRRAVGRLRTGIALTFVAVALMALATTSQWWPTEFPASSTLVVVGAAAKQGAWIEVGTADIVFHTQLVALADSRHLDELSRILSAELRLSFQAVDDMQELHRPFLKLNRKLYTHLARGDTSAAEELLDRYLTQAEERIASATRSITDGRD